MSKQSTFRMLAAASKAADHLSINTSARPFLTKLAEENGFEIDFAESVDELTEENLARYQVFLMLNLAPFEMSPAQQLALQHFIEEGKGWVGIHAAGLVGKEFLDPAAPYWQWFEEFFGGISYIPHPAYQKGTVQIEDHEHPATRNLPASFEISDEWYEFNQSPREHVRVLATADESTFKQNRPMGDHPIIWVNERYRRAIYIALGHDPTALYNTAYCVLLRDAILWAASKE